MGQITADLWRSLHVFSRLETLILDHCSVTSSGMKSVGRNVFASLRELSLNGCSGVTDEILSFLMQAYKDLRKLDVSFCHKRTCASIDSITKSCTSLTTLKMESCGLIAKKAFILIGCRHQFLEELDITANKIEDEGLMAISRCSKLLTLKLRSCLDITDNGLGHLGSGCPMLKELDLDRCSGIRDEGITAITLGCLSLELIRTGSNDKITDASPSSLSKCSRLRALDIRGCSLITSEGLLAIAVGCKQLAVLNIKKCCRISSDEMILLAKSFRNLKPINLSYCSFNDLGLLTLAARHCIQELTILHMEALTPKGLKDALLGLPSLHKVKLDVFFRQLLSPTLVDCLEDLGYVFIWRKKIILG